MFSINNFILLKMLKENNSKNMLIKTSDHQLNGHRLDLVYLPNY